MDDHRSRNQIKLKATLKEVHYGDIDPLSKLEDVKQTVQTWFPFLRDQDAHLDLVFTDNDGDEVTIATEEEWKVLSRNTSGDSLKLTIRAKQVQETRRKESISESLKSGYSQSTKAILQNLPHVDNNLLTSRARSSSNLDSELPHPVSSIVTQPSDDGQLNRNQPDFSPPPLKSPTLDQGSNFTFSNGQNQSSDEDDDVSWPPLSGDTLDKVKVIRRQNSDNVDSRVRSLAHSYPSDIKGRVVIFNHKKFTREPDIQGDFDTTCLCLLFRDLKYDVKSYTDQSVEQIREKLDKEKDFLAKTKYSCYLVFILTHFDPNTRTLSGSKGDTISLDEVTQRINQHDTLKGTPKLLFLDGMKHGRQLKIGSFSPQMTLPTLPLKKPVALERDLQLQGVDSTDSCPSNVMDDFYIYMAGTLGEGSPVYKGSLMLQAVVKIFCENIYTDNLQEMMIKVQQLLDSARTKTERFQMPEVVTNTLKKDLYFNVK